jgi:branched-chain amino acid transport system permease protein
MDTLVPDTITLTFAFAYSLVTLGLFVTLSSGQFSVAHAALMGIGGYAAGITTVSWAVPFPFALAVGAAVSGLFGLAIAFVLQRTSGILLGTVTIALGQAIALTVQNISSLGGSQGYTGIPTQTNLWWAMGLALVAFAFVLLFLRTRIGLDFLAVSRDETVSKALGTSVLTTRYWGFGLGGLLAGLGGGLIAHENGLIKPGDMSFVQEPKFFIFLIIGGFTSPWGALLGTLVMYYVQEVVLRFGDDGKLSMFGHALLDYKDRFWILGLLLIIVVLKRPQGALVRRSLRWRPAREVRARGHAAEGSV